MHRFFWALAIIVVAVGGAGPWVMGNVAESQFQDALSKIPADNPYLTISEASFDKGYQTSTAKMTFTYSFPGSEIEPVVLSAESKINHSPLMSTDQGLIFLGLYSQDRITLKGLTGEVKEAYDTYAGGVVLEGYSTATIFGDYESHLGHDKIVVVNDGSELEIGAFRLEFKGDLAGENIDMKLHMDPSKWVSPEAQAHVEGITGISSLQRHSESLYLGDTVFAIESTKMFMSGMPLELQNIALSSSTTLVGDKLNSMFIYSVEGIEAPIPLTSASYSFELKGLPLEAMEHLSSLDMAMSDDVDANKKILAQIAKELIKPGLELNQELNANAFGGDIVVDLDVKYVGLADGVTLDENTDYKAIAAAIDANILIKAPAIAVQQSPVAPMAGGFVQQGLITQEGDDLVSKITLENGELNINGIQIPLEPILNKLIEGMAAAEATPTAAPAVIAPTPIQAP